jgi:hypothetical protein
VASKSFKVAPRFTEKEDRERRVRCMYPSLQRSPQGCVFKAQMQDCSVVKNPVHSQAWQRHYLYREG